MSREQMPNGEYALLPTAEHRMVVDGLWLRDRDDDALTELVFLRRISETDNAVLAWVAVSPPVFHHIAEMVGERDRGTTWVADPLVADVADDERPDGGPTS